MSSSPSSARQFKLQDPIDPTELRDATPILTTAFYDGADFLHAYHPENHELAIVTKATPRPGSWAVIEIDWHGLPNPVYVRARIYQRHFGVLAKLHPDERRTAEFLFQMAAGDNPHFHLRAHRRYCVRLPGWWRRFGSTDRNSGIVEDLSAGGLLISTLEPPPPPDERVGLRLLVPSAGQDLVITGAVMHARSRSRDFAFGVQFLLRSSGEQRTLRRLLRVFGGRGVVTLE